MIKTSNNDNKKDLFHTHHHLNKLIELYDDVSLDYNGTKAIFSCKNVNEMADDADFNSNTIGVFCNFKLVSPYKKTQVSCDQCDGLVKVFTEPFQIPFYVIPEEGRYSTDYVAQFLVLSYEDVFRRHKFPQVIFAKCKEHIINDIEEHKKLKKNVDLNFLNTSVKNLIIFT